MNQCRVFFTAGLENQTIKTTEQKSLTEVLSYIYIIARYVNDGWF